MMFRRLCAQCNDLVVCSRESDDQLVCARCGGALVGPVALPVPTSYRERCDVLTSPHYTGAARSAQRTK